MEKINLFISFFKNNRKNWLWIILVTYIVGLMVPVETRETSKVYALFVIIGCFGPICIYNFMGWLDKSRPQNKRYFSLFFFSFVSFGVVGIILSIIFGLF